MILTVDIGNTNIVLGGLEGEDIVFEARMATDLHKTSDQYCAELKILLTLYDVDPKAMEGSILSSVVPQLLNSVRSAIAKLTGKTCLVVGPGIKTGLNIRMDNPGEVGSDLIVAAVAATAAYGKPLLLIDMGTATTIITNCARPRPFRKRPSRTRSCTSCGTALSSPWIPPTARTACSTPWSSETPRPAN